MSGSRPSSSSSPPVRQVTPTDSASSLSPPPSYDRLTSHLQIRRQGYTHRPPYIRHLARPTRRGRHPASRGALPTCRRHRHRGRTHSVRRGQPSDASRGRSAREDLVGRAERLGGRPRTLCRFWSGRFQADLDDRERVSHHSFCFLSHFRADDRSYWQGLLWLIGCTRCCDLI